jgi:DNA-binding MarR family transcriptional regulator/RimJ/RimL family protein N-acetyltransferase
MTTDVLAELGSMFLGSRLKRLADRLQTDAAATLQARDMPVQPAQLLLLATLRRMGPLTVGGLADHLRISQPTITRTVTALIDSGLVAASRSDHDQRQKTLNLSDEGLALMRRAERELWPRIEGAVAELCADLSAPLLEEIAKLEAKLDERSLAQRVAASSGAAPALSVRDFTDDLAGAFYRINAEWIEEMFVLEATDIAVLSDPRGRIVDKGGAVLFAETPDLGVVGTCALMKMSDGWFELTKMGVLKAARGRKVGEYLLAQALARAEAMGIEKLYLLTNARCAAAIHLYEKLGFQHDADILADFGGRYDRCDVAMVYRPS